MKQSRPDIYSYRDHHDFLVDQLEYLKSATPGFTVVKLAQSSGVTNSLISMFVSGKRRLTEKALYKLLPHLSLNSAEQSLLRLLWLSNNAESQDEKNRVLTQIYKLRGYQNMNHEDSVTFHYLTKWYYAAIREMSSLPDFKFDAISIQERLWKSVPFSDIEKAIQFLTENKFIVVGPEGKPHPPERKLVCVDDVYSAALSQYYKQMFELALERMPELEQHQKSMNGYMAALSLDGFSKIKSLMDETLQKMVEIVGEDKNPVGVFHFNLLGVPVTKIPKDPGNEK